MRNTFGRPDSKYSLNYMIMETVVYVSVYREPGVLAAFEKI